MLATWGPLQFRVHPLNFHEYDHSTVADFARKDVLGIGPPREWVGEGDEELYIRGKVFPFKIGGLTEVETLDSMRREASAHALVRGDGHIFGWYILEHLTRQHRYPSTEGIGRTIDFEAIFVRVPRPTGEEYTRVLLRLVS